jgi:hypothetical protein
MSPYVIFFWSLLPFNLHESTTEIVTDINACRRLRCFFFFFKEGERRGSHSMLKWVGHGQKGIVYSVVSHQNISKRGRICIM